jgi:hypothetical protein
MKMCGKEGCLNSLKVLGMCNMHYKAHWYQINKEKVKEKQKEYYKTRKDEYSIYNKEYAKKNREKFIKSNTKYREKNKEKISIYRKKYSLKNPEIDRNSNRRKRAIKKQNGFEKYRESDVLSMYGTDCYLCGVEIDLSANRKCGSPGWEYGLHIEHYVDIALGGPDTLENVRPAHAICNIKKKPKGMV